MGLLAVYISVNNETLNLLKKLEEDDLIEELEEIQEDENSKIIDIDKIWDGLHFLLTGVSASEPISNNKLSEFVVGVNVFSEDPFISYSTDNEIKYILEKVNKINLSELELTFEPSAFNENEIYPNIWNNNDKKLLWSELKNSFNSLKDFYTKNKKFNVIVSIY